MIKPIAASESEITDVRAAVLLKCCSLYLVAPNRMERPNTSSTLPMMDPVMEAFTTLVSPLERATPAMISSAAFPNVALSNPPRPSPTRAASASVARPIQPATGIMPRAEQTKSAVGLMPPGQNRRTIAIGTKIRSQSREGLSFRGLGILNLKFQILNLKSSFLLLTFTSSLDELRDRPIFLAEFSDAVLEMAYSTDGTEHQPGAEHDKAEVEQHERKQQR